MDPGAARRGRLPDREGRRGGGVRRDDRARRRRVDGRGGPGHDDQPGAGRLRPPRPIRAYYARPGPPRGPRRGRTPRSGADSAFAASSPSGRLCLLRLLRLVRACRDVAPGVAGAAVRAGPPGGRPGLGPAGVASILRRGLLEHPWNTPSLPLDIGYSETIPASIRRAVLWRDRYKCAWPRCGRPAAWCDVHHIKHKKDGGKTSVDSCITLCQFHHDICVHRGAGGSS